MTQPAPEDTDPRVCCFSLSQLKLVDEFVTYTPPEAIREGPLSARIFPPDTEKQPQYNIIIYGKAKQTPPIWGPLHYKGKLIDLSGANITLISSDEKYPQSDFAIPNNLSLRKEEICILVPDLVFSKIAERVKQENPNDIEILTEVYIKGIEGRPHLHIAFQKMWIRYTLAKTRSSHIVWQIIIGLLAALLLIRLI